MNGQLQFPHLHLILKCQATIGKENEFMKPQAEPFHIDIFDLSPRLHFKFDRSLFELKVPNLHFLKYSRKKGSKDLFWGLLATGILLGNFNFWTSQLHFLNFQFSSLVPTFQVYIF